MVVDGRAVVVVRVDDDKDARGVARAAALSTEGRVVRGRFAAVAVDAVGRVVVVFAGEDLVAELEASVVRRAAGFLFSSPDVTDERSGSASEAVVLDANAGFRTTVPGAGRVGGLFKLDPAVDVRVVELEGGFDAVVAVRVVLDAAGRRAAAPAPMTVVGRRGGTGSFAVDEEFEAILRRAGEAGEAGVEEVARARLVFLGVVVDVDVDSSPEASLAIGGGGGGESMAAARALARNLDGDY